MGGMEYRRFLGQRNYCVLYHNGGYISLYIYQNSSNVKHEE